MAESPRPKTSEEVRERVRAVRTVARVRARRLDGMTDGIPVLVMRDRAVPINRLGMSRVPGGYFLSDGSDRAAQVAEEDGFVEW